MAFAASDEGGGDQNKWIWAYNPSYTSQTWHINNSEGDHISLFGTVWRLITAGIMSSNCERTPAITFL